MNNPIIDLFNDQNKKFVKVCAPMVRYSKYVLNEFTIINLQNVLLLH